MAVRYRTLAATPLEDGSWCVVSDREIHAEDGPRAAVQYRARVMARATHWVSRDRSAGVLS